MLRPSRFQLNTENKNDANSSETTAGNNATLPNKFSSNNSDGESSNSNSASIFANNPFMRAFSKDDDDSSAAANSNNKVNNDVGSVDDGGARDKKDENSDPLMQLKSTNSGGGMLPKSNLLNVKAATISSGTSFVFGQNIGDRVSGQQQSEKSDNNGEDGVANSNSGLLFSNVVPKSPETPTESKEVDSKGLLEATREYEEKIKVNKRKYEEVETITGEEDEWNVLEINCKLFAFEDRNYEERGRGTLHLNDSKVKQNESRLVFRTSGTLRVLINTKIWPQMTVEKPSTKSMRMTAIDSEGHIKVFLVQARPDDITQLFKHLDERVTKLKQISDELEKKSEKLATDTASKSTTSQKPDADATLDDCSMPEANTKSPNKSTGHTICIKINDHETGENECKKIVVDEKHDE